MINMPVVVIQIVRGKTVVSGTGCEICRVEYAAKLECSPDAKIGEAVRLQPEESDSKRSNELPVAASREVSRSL